MNRCIEPDDFHGLRSLGEVGGYAPFLIAPKQSDGGSQRGGLGRAHQLFGEQLPNLLNELNEVLAA